MRIAVLSDIHGNLPALEAVLDALAPYDAVWQLGDVVGYGPQPNEVVARLEREGALGVCGNHEAAALGRIDTAWFNEDARIAIEWTASRLEASSGVWLAALPERRREGDFSLVHGSPRDPIWEYLASVPVARASFAALATPHAIVGHTHDPRIFREDDGLVETLGPSDRSELHLDRRRTLLNPGSVGQPRDGDPRAAGILFDSETGIVTWRRVAYPIERTQGLMRQAGLPRRLIERLDYGM